MSQPAALPTAKAPARPLTGPARAAAGPNLLRLGSLRRDWTTLAEASLTIYPSPEECEPIWRTAVAECACYGFQTYEWQAAWQATIGAANQVLPCIAHVADRDGRTLLLFPLGIYRRDKLSMLSFLGGLVTDYNVPLIAPQFAETVAPAEFATLWRTIVELLPPVDMVWLRRMPKTIEGVRNPMAELPGAWHSEDAVAAILPESFAAFQVGRSTKLFRENRRKRRQLSERGGAVAFSLPATTDEALEILRIGARQKSRRWRETGSRDLFAEPGYLAFNERVTTNPMRTGRIHTACLRVGGEVAAMHWCLIFRGRFYGLLTGYEEKWARFSPGTLLIEDEIKWCIAQPDIQLLDLTVGEESYKRQWADHSLSLYEYIAPRSLRGAAFVTSYRTRLALKRIRWLRNAVRRLKAKHPEPRRGAAPTKEPAEPPGR